jgi:phospholipid/cholesterol/gamma-HCH transport system substrate-binding protein
MRSRTLREGSAGLLILLGVAVLGGLIFWLKGFSAGRRSYQVTVQFPSADGLQVGSSVHYRGVSAGKVTALRVSANFAEVDLKISPTSIVIPKNAVIQTSQSGLVGETFVDILPNVDLSQAAASSDPLSANCDNAQVVCNGAYLKGTPGVTLTELTNSSIRFLNLFSDPAFVAEVRSLTRNSSNAAAGVAGLTKEVTGLAKSVRQELGGLSQATSNSAASIGRAANQFGLTAVQVNQLLTQNRTTITGTLDSIGRISQQIEGLVSELAPTANERGTLVQNLETLSNNAAQASNNLRNLTEAVGSSENILMLQQTLDSARATFQNAQKITSDLDDLTGDPSFRQNVRNLVNSLNHLVSSTQQLQQQTAIASALSPTETTLNHMQRSGPVNQSQLVPLTLTEANALTQLYTLPPNGQGLTLTPIPSEPDKKSATQDNATRSKTDSPQ